MEFFKEVPLVLPTHLCISCPSSTNRPPNSQHLPGRLSNQTEAVVIHIYNTGINKLLKACLTFMQRGKQRTAQRKLPLAGRRHVGGFVPCGAMVGTSRPQMRPIAEPPAGHSPLIGWSYGYCKSRRTIYPPVMRLPVLERVSKGPKLFQIS